MKRNQMTTRLLNTNANTGKLSLELTDGGNKTKVIPIDTIIRNMWVDDRDKLTELLTLAHKRQLKETAWEREYDLEHLQTNFGE